MTDVRNLAAAQVAGDLLNEINSRILEYRQIKTDVAAGKLSAAEAAKAADLALNAIAARQSAIAAIIASNIPEHRMVGGQLQFRNPDGQWGALIDLPPGPAATVQIRSVRAVVGNEQPRAINIGTAQDAIYDLVVPKVIVNALNLSVPQNIAYVGQVV